MRNIFILLIVTIANTYCCFAQLSAEPLVYNYGKVKLWNNQPATFQVTNTTSKTLKFLPTFPQDDLLVINEKKELAPGESTIITAIYYTEYKGLFKKKFALYHNKSDKPFELCLLGKIGHLEYSALTKCPGSKATHDEKKADQLRNETPDENAKEDATLARMEEKMKDEFKKNHPELFEEEELLREEDKPVVIEERSKDVVLIPESTIEQLVRQEDLSNNDNEMIDQPTENTTVVIDTPILIGGPADMEKNRPAFVTRPTETNKPEITVTNRAKIEEAEVENDELSKEMYSANNILFLIDVSLSMEEDEKLPALKYAMKNLTRVLRDIDKLTIITYSTDAALIMKPTTANNKMAINNLIDSLSAAGRTNGVRGFSMAYSTIQENYINTGNNQIIVATDGLFNQYNAKNKEEDLLALIKDNAEEKDIKVSVIAFGKDKKATSVMKKLARFGKGNFIPMDNKTKEELGILVEEIKQQSLIEVDSKK